MTRAQPTSGGLAITIDVEDHSGSADRSRFREAMQPLVDGLSDRQVRATFFVVGSLAERWADEMRELSAAGHEIGLHGFTHQSLARLGPELFASELHRGRDVVGDILGAAPAGYRAPYFSLTAETPWAPDLISAAGFTYSSSVLPAWNPQYGLPGAPRQPFRWASGLIEFPSPVFGFGPLRLPVLGGAYLRLVPAPIVWFAARSGQAKRDGWTYSHPYDFDDEEPFVQLDGQSWIFAKLLFARRHLMLRRVLRLAGANAETLVDRATRPGFAESLATFTVGAD